jgi:hypothetical protein
MAAEMDQARSQSDEMKIRKQMNYINIIIISSSLIVETYPIKKIIMLFDNSPCCIISQNKGICDVN